MLVLQRYVRIEDVMYTSYYFMPCQFRLLYFMDLQETCASRCFGLPMLLHPNFTSEWQKQSKQFKHMQKCGETLRQVASQILLVLGLSRIC